MSTSQFEKITKFSQNLLKKPQLIVENENDSITKESLSMIKSLHDTLIKESNKFKIKNENLVIQNMNEEQIWEQLNIHLNTLDKAFDKYVTTLPEEKEQSESDQDDDDDDDDEESEDIKPKSKTSKKQAKQISDDEDDQDDDEDNGEEHLDLESEYDDEEEEEKKEEKEEEPKKKKSSKQLKKQQVEEDDKEGEDEGMEGEEEDIEGEEDEDEEEEEENDDDMEEENAGDFFGSKEEKEEDYEEKLDFAEMEAFLDKQDQEDIVRDSDAEEELGSDYEMDDGDSQMGEGDKGFKFKGRDDYDDMEEEEEEEEENEEGGLNEAEDEKLRAQDYDIEDEIFDLEREHQINEEAKKDEDLEKVKNDDEIDRLEKKLLADKDWVLKGEINSKARPVNSLVENDVDFRKNIKVTQEIDEKYNQNLESIIKQRILDEAFDDRQRINFEQNFKETFNNFAEISKEKSKLGLGELYEQDFKNSLGLPKNNKEDKLKLDIHNLFKEVCYKLDALSNLSFTPKPVHQQAQISTNVPSLKHEERIPISVSQADTQRPEEVFNKKREVTFHSKVEMSHDEKQTERRQKKSAQRQRNKEKEKKKLIKNLQYNGQTKFEYNQSQKAKANATKLLEGKRQKSVEFTKSSEFFKNMQNNQQLNAGNGKNTAANHKTKPIKKTPK